MGFVLKVATAFKCVCLIDMETMTYKDNEQIIATLYCIFHTFWMHARIFTHTQIQTNISRANIIITVFYLMHCTVSDFPYSGKLIPVVKNKTHTVFIWYSYLNLLHIFLIISNLKTFLRVYSIKYDKRVTMQCVTKY